LVSLYSENTSLKMTTIIIIIWHYNPLWVFVFSAKSLQVLLSLATPFQILNFRFFGSSMTYSCHLCLVVPTGLVPIGFPSNSLLVGLAWSILWICPSHLILCALINLTVSVLSIKLSISMLFRILHTLSILRGFLTFLTSLTFAFQKCVGCFHILLLKSKSLMSRRLPQ